MDRTSASKASALVSPQLARHIDVVVGPGFGQAVQNLQAPVVVLVIIKGDGVERAGVVVVLAGLVELHTLNAVRLLHAPADCLRLFQGHIGKHEPGRAGRW